MARKTTESASAGSLYEELIKDTDFQFVTSESKMFSNRPTVETPCLALNCLFGGGLPLGMIMECAGPPTSGKSSFCYEVIADFQRQYPDGIAIILDSETSSDPLRLSALGVDINPPKLLYMGANTLEVGFSQINTILSKIEDNPKLKDVPVIIVWDTIAGSATNAQVETGKMYGGGISEAPRIIKNSLKAIFPRISNNNVLLILINQVMAEIGAWRPGVTSGGGFGLKHDIHLKLEFSSGKTSYDGIFASTKSSTLSVTKSKISPLVSGMNIEIDSRLGGKIDREGSFLWLLSQYPEIFNVNRGWYLLTDQVFERYGAYLSHYPDLSTQKRYNDILNLVKADHNLLKILELVWMDMIMDRYTLQKRVCQNYYDSIKNDLNMVFDIKEEPVVETIDNSISDLESDDVDINELESQLASMIE